MNDEPRASLVSMLIGVLAVLVVSCSDEKLSQTNAVQFSYGNEHFSQSFCTLSGSSCCGPVSWYEDIAIELKSESGDRIFSVSRSRDSEQILSAVLEMQDESRYFYDDNQQIDGLVRMSSPIPLGAEDSAFGQMIDVEINLHQDLPMRAYFSSHDSEEVIELKAQTVLTTCELSVGVVTACAIDCQ